MLNSSCNSLVHMGEWHYTVFKIVASHFVLATLNLGWRKNDTILEVKFDTLKLKTKKMVCDIQNSFYNSCTSNKGI